VGITGQLTGSRADLIIADDIETPKNSLTQTMRDRLAELVKEFDAVLKPDGRVVYLGTPQCEMSLYNRLPERGYQIRVWPARYRKDLLKQADRLAPMILENLEKHPELAEAHMGRGEPTDLQRFSDQDLLEREVSYGRAGFALQFQLDTSLSDADRYPLRAADFLVMGLDLQRGPVAISWGSGPQQIISELPCVGLSGDRWHRPMFVSQDFAPWTGSIMWVDPSGRGKDETAWVILKMLFGTLFLADWGGFREGYSEATLKALAVKALTHKVNYIGVEANYGDGMFTQIWKPVLAKIHPCEVEDHKVHGQKEVRIIDTLEPVLSQHRLVISQEAIEREFRDTQEEPQYGLIHQLTRITKERGSLRQDDRVDCLAQAVAYWVEQMNQDTQRAAEDHRQELLEQELQRFMDSALGYSSGGPKWVQLG
jgi:hypothetical protein